MHVRFGAEWIPTSQVSKSHVAETKALEMNTKNGYYLASKILLCDIRWR